MGSRLLVAILLLIGSVWGTTVAVGEDKAPHGAWRSLPLVKQDKVSPDWVHIGWGGFAVEDGSLRTECDEKGMGLLLYRKERFGDCQIRVVYKSKDSRSNAGVFVRIDSGILERLNEKPAAVRRGKDGKLVGDSLKRLMEASEKEQGPWYAVHHGYEVQICDGDKGYHGTGAIYSLARAAATPKKRATEWKTMVITLQGDQVMVDIDGQRVTAFDPEGKDVPLGRKWFEPKREPKRPRLGYLGLQNHDPGDVVYFKEVAVRPLEAKP